MSKIDFDRRLVDLDGRALPFGDKPISHLKDIVAHALLVATDARGDGTEMHLRYKMAQRVKKGGEIGLDEVNLERVKICVAATCSTIATGIIYDLLDEASGENDG